MLSTHKCINAHKNHYTFNIDDYLDVSGPITYNILSDLQILEPLMQDLSMHDILILKMVSKSLTISISKLQKIITETELFYDSINYDCWKCAMDIKNLYTYPSQNAKIFLECIKHKSFKILNALRTYLIELNDETDYPVPDTILDEGGDKDNFIYQCIIESQNHKDGSTLLLEHITHHFQIAHIDMIPPICINSNKNVFENMFRNWNLGYVNITINKECMMLMLHNMCLYGMKDVIKNNIVNIIDWKFLIELVTINKNIYENDIINIILNRMLMGYIQNEYMNDYIKLVNQYGNEKLLIDIVKTNYIHPDYKVKFVGKSYQLKISQHLSFLDSTTEFNMLSIKMAISNGDGSIYTSNLTFEQILNLIMSTSYSKIKEKLILAIRWSHYISTDNEKSMEIIARWSVNNDNMNCVKHLISLKNVSINIKKILISYIYKKNIDADISFLKESEELNILSIEQADKYRLPGQEITIGNCPFTKNHNGQTIYTKKLSVDNILKLIFGVSNKNLKEILIYDLAVKITFKFDKIQYDEPDYVIPKCKSYDVIKDTLPKHYKYNKSVSLYEDNTQIYECKPKINENVLNLDYTKLLLDMDESLYVEIFETIIKLATNNYTQKCKSKRVIKFLIGHQKFNDIKPSTILQIFNIYHLTTILKMSDTIFNHSFFDKFK
jgi:hypothetical protein